MCGSKQLLSHLAELSGLIINPQTLNRRRRNRRVEGSGFRMSAVGVRVHEILSFSCASLVIATQHTAKLVEGPLHPETFTNARNPPKLHHLQYGLYGSGSCKTYETSGTSCLRRPNEPETRVPGSCGSTSYGLIST